jgi:hypothetical protein
MPEQRDADVGKAQNRQEQVQLRKVEQRVVRLGCEI